MLRALAPALLLAAALAGCADDGDGAPDGHFVYFEWSRSVSQCVNGDCTYGSNRETFSLTLECDVDPTLSWDANSWVHGSVAARVHDSTGTQVGGRIVDGNGRGSERMEGKGPTWTFEGATSNANGNMEIRLACVRG